MKHLTLSVLVSATLVPSAQAATNWESCPAPPSADGPYNVLLVVPGDNFVTASNQHQAQMDALDRWCRNPRIVYDKLWPERGVVMVKYMLCRRDDKPQPRDADFPAVPGVVIWCGDGPAAGAGQGAPAGPAAAAPPPKCSARDIEGRWTRTDGAVVEIQAMKLNGGGRALMYSHPGQWPKTLFKFSSIRQREGCTYDAVCHTVHRNGGNGGYNVEESPCELKLDKAAGTLLAPGNHGSYKR